MQAKSVYLAGPIDGYSYIEAVDWRDQVTESLKGTTIQVYSPVRGKDFLVGEKVIDNAKHPLDSDAVLGTPKGIVTRDRNDASKSGVILFNFLGAKKVSIGSMIEIGWGDSCRVPMIAVMEKDNVHWHIMVQEMCLVVPSLEKGIDLVKHILLPWD